MGICTNSRCDGTNWLCGKCRKLYPASARAIDERKREQRRDAARARGRPPGSTYHVGRPHTSGHSPDYHADREVTDQEGRTTKEHSTDPRDINFGERIEDAQQRRRRGEGPR